MPNYDGSDRKDILIRQIREAIAEENRKEIIDRLKKGREERVRKGKMAGGTLPYGYSRINKDIINNKKSRRNGDRALNFLAASPEKLAGYSGTSESEGLRTKEWQVLDPEGSFSSFEPGIII